MADYLQEGSTVRRSNSVLHLSSPTLVASTERQQKEKTRFLDTLSSVEGRAKGKNILPGARPALAPSKSKAPEDMLAMIAEAFSKAYGEFSKGVINQTHSYAELQHLNEVQSQAILASTGDVVQKQEEALKKTQEIADTNASYAGVEKVLNYLGYGLGAILLIGSIVSVFVTDGATAPLVAEEAAALEGAEGLGTVLEGGAEEMIGLGGEDGLEELSNLEEPAVEESAGAPVEAEVDTASSTQEAETNVTRQTEKSAEEAAEAKTNWKQKLLHWGLKFGFATAAGTPNLVQAINQGQLVPKFQQLAEVQKEVGDAQAVLTRNNMYFQFLQQGLQREGGVLNMEIESASKVIDTYASITSAMRNVVANAA